MKFIINSLLTPNLIALLKIGLAMYVSMAKCVGLLVTIIKLDFCHNILAYSVVTSIKAYL